MTPSRKKNLSQATPHANNVRHWTDRLFQPVDAASLAFFRFAFGVIMLCEIGRFFYNGWIDSVYVAPQFHFSYFGLAWVRPWPGIGMYLHFFALGILAAMIALGLRYRLAAALFCVGFAYVFVLEKAEYLNHFYLVGLLSFWLVFVPAQRLCSLDARFRPELRRDYVPAWTLWLLRLQVAVPYVYGGIAKLNGDWLRGQPLELWMSRMTHVRTVIPAFGEPWLALLFSYGGLLLDLFVVPLLLWRRTRYAAFCCAVAFHLTNAVLFRIGVFPWLMICATTLFLSPDWPRRLLRQPRPERPESVTRLAFSLGHKAVATLLIAVMVVELLVPFRHWLYPGNVDWTDEGSRFSWRMMLSDKTAAIQILLVDPQTGHKEPVDPRPLLTPKQLDRLSYDPEMLREFAAYLKAELVRDGLGGVEVHVISLCSLNGRKPQLMVDPRVDLGAQPRLLAPAPWIVPLTEPFRDEPWTVPHQEWEKYVDIPNVPQR